MADVKQTEQASDDVLVCEVHPKVETSLRCNKCNRLMCTKCAVRTPVGYRCKQCVRGQQDIFFNANTSDPVIQIVVSVVTGAVGAVLIGLLNFGIFSWLIAFWAGSAGGALIADIAHRLVGKRRGRYGWLFVAGGIIFGGVLSLAFGLSISKLIFVGMAVVAAVGRLKLGR